MTFKLSICGTLLLAAASVGAQVASHAPTAVNPAPQGQAASPQQTPGKPVVRVNGTVFTEVDVLREEYAIFPYGRQHNGIPKDLEPGIRAGALKMMVFEELVYQEALRRKMVIPAVKLQQAEAAYRKTFSSPDQFKAFIQSDFHGSHQLLQEKIRRSLLIDELMKQEVENKATVSPAEIKAYYDKNLKLFTFPESFTFQTISIMLPADAKGTPEEVKAQKARAETAIKRAKATKSADEFGLLAEKISDDDYRVMMGQHKPVPREEIAPQIVKALLALPVGGVSDLLQVDDIYTIVRFQAHTMQGTQKLEEVRAKIEKQLKEDKTSQLRSALDAKLHQGAKIEKL